MAIYKSVKGVGKHTSRLKAIIDYVSHEEKEGERVYKTTGINVSDNAQIAFKQMMITKRLHDNTQGRQYRHHIQSFDIGEVDGETAHKLGVEFAEKHFKNFDVFVATHVDKEHVHNHFIINTVSRETGKKFRELNKQEIAERRQSKKAYETHEFSLEKIKSWSDEMCVQYGLSVIDRSKGRKSLNIYNSKEYKAITKDGGKSSYKTQLAIQVMKAIKTATSKEDFIKKMKGNGVEVIWKDSRKNITFKFDDKKKKSIRLSNLKKTYNEDEFDKSKMLEIFEKNAQDQEQKIVAENINITEEREQTKEESSEERYARILAEAKAEEQARKQAEEQAQRELKAKEKAEEKEREKEKATERAKWRKKKNIGWER